MRRRWSTLYFDGCSTGGRMAMIEAERYPEDYQGVIVGDPMMSFNVYTARAVVQKAALIVRRGLHPRSHDRGDRRKGDGAPRCDRWRVKDGLVQDPAACSDPCRGPALSRPARPRPA